MNASHEIEPWEDLYRYWLARHVGGRPPRRSEIDPMIDLPHLAANLVMIDLRPDGYEYRLIGSEVVSRFGIDHTGKKVGTASNVDQRRVTIWRQGVDAVAREGRPHLLASHYPGAETTQAVAVVLPLAPDADGLAKLLGAIFFERPFPKADAYKGLAFIELVLGT